MALGLATATVYELATPSDDLSTGALPAHARLAAPIAAPVYAPPAAEQFAALDSRAPFNPARTPLPDIAPATGGAAEASDFTLVGVIMDGTRAVALLHSKSTSSTTSASVGDLVNGWRVSRIEATAVTLQSNQGDFVVVLATPGSQLPSAPLPPLSSEAPPEAPARPAAPSPHPPAHTTGSSGDGRVCRHAPSTTAAVQARLASQEEQWDYRTGSAKGRANRSYDRRANPLRGRTLDKAPERRWGTGLMRLGFRCRAYAVGAALGVAALFTCSALAADPPPGPSAAELAAHARDPASPAPPAMPAQPPAGPAQPPAADIVRGSGDALGHPAPRADAVIGEDGGITLNFINADVRDVAKAVLGDFLNVNYALGAGVQGTITVQTSKPIARTEVLPFSSSSCGSTGSRSSRPSVSTKS